MAKITGTISRIHATECEHSHDSHVIILLVESPTVYKGRAICSTELLGNTVKLTAPGDQVTFEYDDDFRITVRKFENHTLAEMM